MYTRRNIRWSVIVRFGWKKMLLFTAWSSAVVILFLTLQDHGVDCSLPIAPLGTIGIAVAFYIGFKNNQSYDRSWEARKIWGGIVNVSRAFANQVISFISDSDKTAGEQMIKELHRDLVYRQIAWINTLRFSASTQNRFWPSGTQHEAIHAADKYGGDEVGGECVSYG